MTDTPDLSRRGIFGGAGLGLALAAAPLLAPGTAEAATPDAVPLQDPRTKYAKPPFSKQTQPWPGLASKMDPVPDHGETSYRGSGRLQGRKALFQRQAE